MGCKAQAKNTLAKPVAPGVEKILKGTTTVEEVSRVTVRAEM